MQLTLQLGVCTKPFQQVTLCKMSSLLYPGHLFVRISPSVHHSPLWKGLDADRDGLPLIDDDFCLHLTEVHLLKFSKHEVEKG